MGTSAELARLLRSQTPARVGLRRAGLSLATSEILDFQLAHARARDAVYAPLQPSSLRERLRSLPHPIANQPPIVLHSQVADRKTYLQRPDLGRKLDPSSRERLQNLAQSANSCAFAFDLGIILADGLSALAIDRHAAPLLAALFPALDPAQRIAPICIAEQARVALGDEVAHILRAQLLIVLIGERPGLSSPDSLGAYITWQPQPGRTTDADRNCISNIRAEGLSYPQAATRLLYYIQQAQSRQLTGVTLKDPENPPARQIAPAPVPSEVSQQ